jgi:hypothetical protein
MDFGVIEDFIFNINTSGLDLETLLPDSLQRCMCVD